VYEELAHHVFGLNLKPIRPDDLHYQIGYSFIARVAGILPGDGFL
jgi:hypothetical protein